jgi:hypothetical protein
VRAPTPLLPLRFAALAARLVFARPALFSVLMLTAVPAPRAWAQGPAAREPRRALGAATVADTGTRFRFIERYAVEPDRTKSGILTQYQVAALETIKTSVETAQGAPVRSQTAFRTIYTERVARVGTGTAGDVLDAIRRYDKFRPVPDRTRPGDYLPLEGLTLWFHPRVNDEPLMLSLTDRTLSDQDHLWASHHVFLPDLRGLLPVLPSRVGDTWRVPASAMRALLCDPSARGRDVSATLVDVRGEKSDAGPGDWVAVISVTGRAETSLAGQTALNAELEFRFTPPARAASAARKDEPARKDAPDESTVEARGAISELRMAVARQRPASDEPNQRRRATDTWEFVLQRRTGDGTSPLMPLPAAPPQPTEANSWLTLVPPQDPARPHFTFRHPQELLTPPSERPTADSVTLQDRWPDWRDQLNFVLVAKTGKPDQDRPFRDPEFHRQQMLAQWARERLEVVQGPHEWLPAADWEPHKMKVWRMQAALKETRRETRGMPRNYIDFYVVLFGRDQCLLVTATTSQDPPAAFRKQTEAVLKTFRFDAANPKR